MKLRSGGFVVCASVLVLLATWRSHKTVPSAARSNSPSGANSKVARPCAVKGYGKLPINFEVNQGQTDSQVRFLARGQGYTLFLTSQHAVLSLRKSEARSPKGGELESLNAERGVGRFALLNDRSSLAVDRFKPQDTQLTTNAVVEMRLVGAKASARVTGAEELPGKSNYFIGNDPKKWRTNIPTYAKVRVEDVYPGVDLVYYGNQGQLEYDFVVRPGANPKAIRLALTSGPSPERSARPGSAGAGEGSPVKIDATGDLAVQADGGEVRFHKPVMYQPASICNGQHPACNGQHAADKTPVDGHYTSDEQNQVAFTIGEYDRTRPLVIDPVLAYSTYFGGSGGDSANGIAVDGSGDAYVTGLTKSTDFPTTPYAFQARNHGNGNVFVTKFNPDGSALLYSTYLGGSGGDSANGIAVDGSGNAYVTGTTRSTDFPTVNPFQATNHMNTFFCCSFTAFVTKLDATGSALVYSTYLGGHGGGVGDIAKGIAVDSSGNAYIAGYTDSGDFPTANAIQPTNHSASDPRTNGFVSEFNATGSALTYSTYLGGSGNASGGDSINAIAVDNSGNAYMTGFTRSRDFPTTPNALQPTCSPGPAGCNGAFVTKINAGGSTLAYSTYLEQANQGEAIAVDGSGNAYVTGYSAFAAKLNARGSRLAYFTNLGGNGLTVGTGIALRGPGFAYVTGYTYANNFPTADPLQATNHAYANGGDNAFVTLLTPDGAGLVYSTYLGGSGSTHGLGIAVDGSGKAYVTGFTRSGDFPTSPNAFQPTNRTYNGYFYDATAFVAKISLGGN